MGLPAIYLHSRHADFADTQRLTQNAYLGRPLNPAHLELCVFSCGCGCGKDHLLRIPRSFWMRLLPLFRLYRCGRCFQRVLRTRIRQRHVYSATIARK
jgi:hypothetical protein